MKPLFLLLSTFFIAAAGFAESAFDREMKALKGQRDAAVAAATKAPNERYRASLEQVLRRATQAKDAASTEAIRTELLTLGPLRETPAVGAPTTSKPALPSTMFGKWSVDDAFHTRADYVFKQDGTCEHIPAVAQAPDKVGTWSKEANKIQITWPDGSAEAFDLPIKGGKLDGYNTAGHKRWATKSR